ncbi:hypothetical protein SESBI_27172 [Sesbania bispinosa]|nr:hypothetical protein SESBI_27172 [Sesbania bispinosa]
MDAPFLASAFFLNMRDTIDKEIQDTSIDAVFSEDDSEMLGDDSDSDGFLSEDSSCAHVTGSDGENENYIENSNGGSSLSVQNRDIHAELLKKEKKLNRLKEKFHLLETCAVQLGSRSRPQIL